MMPGPSHERHGEIGVDARAALERLEQVGPFAGVAEYLNLANVLVPYWTEDIAAVNIAIEFLVELADERTDPDDRDGCHLDAVSLLHEAACAWGGYTADELLDQEMEEAERMDSFDRELGLPLTDEIFPVPR